MRPSFIVSLLAVLLSLGGAALADPVVVRFGSHAGYGRVVFEWPSEVSVSSERQGERLILSFARRAEFAGDPFAGALPPFFRSIETRDDGERTILVAAAEPGADLKLNRWGAKIVVDATRPREKSEPKAASPAAREQLKEQPKDAPKGQAREPTRLRPAEPPKPTAPPPATPPSRIASDERAPASEPAAKTPPPTEPPKSVTPRAASVLAPLPNQIAVAVEPSGEGALLRFLADQPLPAAALQRAGALFLLFEGGRDLAPLDLPRDSRGAVLKADVIDIPGANLLRLQLKPGLSPILSRRDNEWLLDLRPAAEAVLPQSVEVSTDTARSGARLLAALAGAGRPHAVIDPEVGDQLVIVPSVQSGLGLNLPRNYPQVGLLPTAQGLAFQPRSDQLRIERVEDGVEVRARDGMLLADLPKVNAQPSQGMLRLAEWRGPADGFTATEHALQERLGEGSAADRAAARLSLARFYLANQFAQEALGLLSRLSKSDPKLFEDRGNRLLRAAAAILSNRPNDAEADLAHPSLAGDGEAAMWRGRMLIAKGQPAEARDEFLRSGTAFNTYPLLEQARILLEMGQAFVQAGDLASAHSVLALLERIEAPAALKAESQYWRGRLAERRNERPAALAAYQVAMQDGSRPVAMRARLAHTNLELGEKQIEPAVAVDRLEGLRYAWRGDRLELDTLYRLGQLYLQGGDYRAALGTLKQAITQFPKSADAKDMAADMNRAFEHLFLNGMADRMPPVEALGLFFDFRELAPVGKRGDEMIKKLADRLVRLDLLDRAGDLVDHQVNARLKGDERARAAIDLATIRLLDRKPEAALKALQFASFANPSEEQKGERRQLEARALIDLERYDQALKLLQGDATPAADLLRVEVSWRAKNWREAAQSLSQLLKPRAADDKPLSSGERQQALQLAVALSLAGDGEAIERLRGQFARRFENTPEAPAFRVLTTRVNRNETEFRQLATSIAGVNNLEAFMAGYRERLKQRSAKAAS